MRTSTLALVCLAAIAALAVSGCASGGMFPAANITNVQLERNNFTIIARNVAGEAQAGYLLGGTFSVGMTTNTFGLVRVSGRGMLYKEALENLWKNVEATCGPVEKRKLALINVRYDSEALNLVVYTEPKVMVRADVIEFTD